MQLPFIVLSLTASTWTTFVQAQGLSLIDGYGLSKRQPADCASTFANSVLCDLSNCESGVAFCCCCDTGFERCATGCCEVTTAPATGTLTSVPGSNTIIDTTSSTDSTSAFAIFASNQPFQTTVPSVPSGFKTTDVSVDDPRISYDPPGDWADVSNDLPGCLQGTKVRLSKQQGSNFTFPFNGTSVFVRALLSPTGGNFSISVDDGPVSLFNSFSSTADCGFSSTQNASSNPSNDLIREIRIDVTRLAGDNSGESKLLVKNLGGDTAVAGVSYQQKEDSGSGGGGSGGGGSSGSASTGGSVAVNANYLLTLFTVAVLVVCSTVRF